jgi:splicing factor 3B subunit 2
MTPGLTSPQEFEVTMRQKRPGDLSDELRNALGMPTGPVCDDTTYFAVVSAILAHTHFL